MSPWYVARLTTYLDLESLKIRRSGFNFKSNLTSAIGDLANCDTLASYVSRPNAMAYDKHSTTTKSKELSPKVIIVVRMKIYPKKLTITRMIPPSDCNAQLCTPQG